MRIRNLTTVLGLGAWLLTAGAWAQTEKTDAPVIERDVDHVRLRGGFSFNGGIGLVTGSGTTIMGPAGSIAARLGVQFNHLLSIYYQQTPQGFVLSGPGGVAAMFLDYNSVLLNLTLADTFEIGAGPSLDFAATAALADLSVATTTGTGFGIHGRVAAIIGGRSPGSARRSGFAIGADIHPFFLDGVSMFMMTVGIGADWY